jgi:NADPH-dependent 2,4-dienoyl-CoA reductase/sulfur reductase-like enzyme
LTGAVIVGASLAGLRAAEALRREGWTDRIRVIGAEPHKPYDRPPLSKQMLTGEWSPEQTELRHDDDIRVDWILGRKAVALDITAREVYLEDGERVGYERLLIATGASPRTIPGTDHLAGVHVLRTLDDAQRIAHAMSADPPPKVAVVGAGFIGAEVASSARARGLEVTVVEALPAPLSRALGDELGGMCAALHDQGGTTLRLGVGVSELEDDGSGAVHRLRLADGSSVDADIVVVGIGVAPETGWLESSGLLLENGVRCDEWLRVRTTSGSIRADICAAGDLAHWDHAGAGRGVRLEHWTNAVEQATRAAATLTHGPTGEPFAPVPYFWSDQYGVKIQHVGLTLPSDDVHVLEGSTEERKLVAAIGRDGVMVGAFCIGAPAKTMRWKARLAGPPIPFPPTE